MYLFTHIIFTNLRAKLKILKSYEHLATSPGVLVGGKIRSSPYIFPGGIELTNNMAAYKYSGSVFCKKLCSILRQLLVAGVKNKVAKLDKNLRFA